MEGSFWLSFRGCAVPCGQEAMLVRALSGWAHSVHSEEPENRWEVSGSGLLKLKAYSWWPVSSSNPSWRSDIQMNVPMENSVHPDHSNWIEYVYINVLFLCRLVNATFQNSLTLDVHWIWHVAHHYLWLNVTLLLPLQSACFCFLSFHSSYNSPSRPLADEEGLLISLLRWYCHHQVSLLAVSFTQMPCRRQSSTWFSDFWILKSGTGDGISFSAISVIDRTAFVVQNTSFSH